MSDWSSPEKSAVPRVGSCPISPWSPMGPMPPMGPRGPMGPIGPMGPMGPGGPGGPGMCGMSKLARKARHSARAHADRARQAAPEKIVPVDAHKIPWFGGSHRLIPGVPSSSITRRARSLVTCTHKSAASTVSSVGVGQPQAPQIIRVWPICATLGPNPPSCPSPTLIDP